MRFRYMLLTLALALCGCSETDTGVGVTSSQDYTLAVSVRDRFIRVDDVLPVRVQLRRTDNSNLPQGLKGSILLTATANGALGRDSIAVNVTGATVPEVSENVAFTGKSPGSAEVRATFLDATAKVEIVISRVVAP